MTIRKPAKSDDQFFFAIVASKRACVHAHIIKMVLKVQQIDWNVPVLLRALCVIMGHCANIVSFAYRTFVPNFGLDMLEMPIDNQLVRRELRNWISGMRNSPSLAIKFFVECCCKICVACTRFPEIIAFLDLPAFFVKVNHRERVECSTKRVTCCSNCGTLATSQILERILHTDPQAVVLAEEAIMNLTIAALRPTRRSLPSLQILDQRLDIAGALEAHQAFPFPHANKGFGGVTLTHLNGTNIRGAF